MISTKAIALAMLGCIAFSTTSVNAEPSRTEPEILLGIAVSPEDVALTVYSGGCTGNDSFRFESDKAIPPRVTVFRTQADVCRAHLPDGVELRFSRHDLGLAPGVAFVLSNPLAAPGSQGTPSEERTLSKKAAGAPFTGEGKVRHLEGISFCMDGAKYELERSLGGIRLSVENEAMNAALDDAARDGYPVLVKGEWVQGPECRRVQVSDVAKVGGKWSAWVNLMPGSNPTLHVKGEVLAPATGSSATLVERSPAGINPAILMLDLNVVEGTGAPKQLEVRFSKPAQRGLNPREVQVFRGGKEVARVDVGEAH